MTNPNPAQEDKRSWKRGSKKPARRSCARNKPDVEIALCPGDFVASYQVLGELGHGAFGLVFSGVMPPRVGGTVTKVALKTFLGPADSKELREVFKREAMVWAGLGFHWHIVAAYGVVERQSRPFIVLDYVSNRGRNTLEDHLREPIVLEQALKWAIEFCSGMEHAVSHGVACHGDIKPANIMIEPDGTLRITDFGLANFFKSETALTALGETVRRGGRSMSIFRSCDGTKIAGTPAYMAPEQFKGKADIRSDIYGFGILLYQMQNHGTHPFGMKNSPDAWRGAHESKTVAPLNTPLFPVIKKCLNKCPEDRYQGFEHVRGELERIWQAKFPQSPRGVSDEMHSGGFVEAVRGLCFGATLEAFGEHEKAKREFAAAEIAIKRECDSDPNDQSHWVILGDTRHKQGNYAGAEEAYQHACDLNPEDSESLWGLGLSRYRQQKYAGAEEAMSRACGLDPNDPEHWCTLGDVRLELERYESAEEAYKHACSLDPQSPVCWRGLAVARRYRHNYAGAEEAYIRTCDLEPNNPDHWTMLGLVLLRRQNDRGAEEAFKRARHLSPPDEGRGS